MLGIVASFTSKPFPTTQLISWISLTLDFSHSHFRKEYNSGLSFLLETLSSYGTPLKKVVVAPSVGGSTHKLTKAQINAARDPNRLIRLIAAPGTGKSLAIEERVRWLLSNGIDPKTIYVVSFTRAASRDLRDRIVKYCLENKMNQVHSLSVTTLHSLALKVLRKAKQLHYPAGPQVLDEWELENIFDSEFSETMRYSEKGLESLTPSRVEDIRQAWEAFWNTGKWDHPAYLPPENPVTEIEKSAFRTFHGPTTKVYSCVLPGEIVKMCVDKIDAGVLDPVSILGTQHLIVDEFQDLNYTDLQFVDSFIRRDVTTFVAGDDDQSIYSFRYAYPTGIQKFAENYSDVITHYLNECFRCTPHILDAAQHLVQHYQSPGRIAKTAHSFCVDYTPRIEGIIHRWSFKSEHKEYEAIASSCRALIDRGIRPRDILILVSNRKALLPGTPSLLQIKFDDLGIPIEMPTGERFIDTKPGRLAYALTRIACDLDLEDYIAHRTVLGCLRGVGSTAYNGIRTKVIDNHLNYLDVFYSEFPSDIFTKTEVKAIEKLQTICKELRDWRSDDRIVDRTHIIARLVEENLGAEAAQVWLKYIEHLPDEMSMGELRAYLSTDNSEQQESLLKDVYNRLELQIPDEGLLPQCVRVMTMHGAKGLNADVVFVPGLEEDILPGEKRKKRTGLVHEAARQLYVSITRARLACFVTYATSRRKYGRPDFSRSASQYCTHLLGAFQSRENGLTDANANEIVIIREVYATHMETRLSRL